MVQKSILELAKQGNPKAIAALVNRSLVSQNITAKAQLRGECLHLLLESAQVPNQKALVTFIHKGMVRLSAESIKTVKIYGRQLGTGTPVWYYSIELRGNAASTTEPKLLEQIPSLPPLRDCLITKRKKVFLPPSKATKQLVEELLELVNYEQAKAENILSEIVFQNSHQPLEWCLERAISKLLQNQRFT